MSYLQLTYRRKADLECSDDAARKADMALVDEWREKTMNTRKENEEKKNAAAGKGITLQ
jgi:hypothetical protein